MSPVCKLPARCCLAEVVSPVLVSGCGGSVVAWLSGVWSVVPVYGVGAVLYGAFALLLVIWWGVIDVGAVCGAHFEWGFLISSVEGKLSCDFLLVPTGVGITWSGFWGLLEGWDCFVLGLVRLAGLFGSCGLLWPPLWMGLGLVSAPGSFIGCPEPRPD